MSNAKNVYKVTYRNSSNSTEFVLANNCYEALKNAQQDYEIVGVELHHEFDKSDRAAEEVARLNG